VTFSASRLSKGNAMDSVLLAQDQGFGAAGAVIILLFVVVYLVAIGLAIASVWRVFTKAGEPGWKALIPFYNYMVFFQIVGRPAWWLVWMFVPFANIVVGVIVLNDLAKSFGKDTAFTVGLILLGIVFLPLLAFGDARYLGPAGPEPRPGWPNLGQSGYGGYSGYGQGGYGQVGYPAQPQVGYPAQPQVGYPAQPQVGYPAQPQVGYGQPDQPWGQPTQPEQQWGQPAQQWGPPPSQ
jgi:hypothetical protein